MRYFVLLLLIIALLFSSCTTVKDVVIDSPRDHSEQRLTELEAVIVPLEADRQRGNITSARQMISRMERETSADPDFSGQLLAWSGRLAILEGRYSEAVRLHRQSIAASPGNLPAIILGIRLEGDPLKRMEMIERELGLTGRSGTGVGELNIERGRALTELERFSEAAGAFDIAFASELDNIYRESYMEARNRAWELRHAAGLAAGTSNILGRETISWNDSITMANNETQLLRFITGGRNISDTELFNRLVERAFIPYTQDITVNNWSAARPRADEAVTRAGAAWLIWHLFAESRGERGLLSRYSARYATGANPRSPITDVPALSPFFDSILGCIESEFMSLPDGRNFNPNQPIRGAELLAILRRIDD